jgi:VanZ family protein
MTLLRQKRLAWLLVIFWTFFIFSFSLQPLEGSSSQSKRVQEHLQPLVEAVEDMLGVELIPDNDLHRAIRKVAHFALFMVLGALSLWAGWYSGWTRKQGFLTAVLWVLAAASVDETLQTFIPGRSGELRDVIIDTAGGLAGMAILLLIGRSVMIWQEFSLKR